MGFPFTCSKQCCGLRHWLLYMEVSLWLQGHMAACHVVTAWTSKH